MHNRTRKGKVTMKTQRFLEIYQYIQLNKVIYINVSLCLKLFKDGFSIIVFLNYSLDIYSLDMHNRIKKRKNDVHEDPMMTISFLNFVRRYFTYT